MAKMQQNLSAGVIGGVDTHKDLHVAAVVDHNNCVVGNEFFPATRQGYRQMLSWMKSFGPLIRVGIECTGYYGAGLLRYLQAAGIEVLEVTAPTEWNTGNGEKAIRLMLNVPLMRHFHSSGQSRLKHEVA